MGYDKFVFDENSPALINNEHCIQRPDDSVNRMLTEEPVNGIQGDIGDYVSKGSRLKKKFGLGWPLTGLLVVGEMAGSGIVALPTAIVRCGFWPGLAILLIMAFMGITAAVLLGKSWVILLKRFPVYRTHCRRPYPEIAMRAMGVRAKYIVTACVNVSMFGVTVVFLLLCAKNTRDFLHAFLKVDMSECILMLIIALALLPVTFLKSPKDFWHAVVLGMASTVLAYVLIIAGSVADYTDCSPESQMPELKWSNMLLGMGTIRFTYGGHATFPTIQHDMRDPASFDKSSILAISLITMFNIIMVTACGLAYGSSLRASVLNSIQSFWIQQATNIMITLHCLFTLCLVVNPFSQTFEDLFHVPQGFGLKRVLLRSITMLAVVFTAATIPNFGSVLNLIGSSTTTCTSAVFPCVFYLYISAADKRSQESEDPKNQTPISFVE
ncbi:transmembrane amino acid transporter protein domain-containing protein [Ditylenchus destructor]|uniref:Transmembrane amino acid transporter protein domain-containing protein n=1 Tax=Ditylenchus destructor TaxID=166010 RepID=A0AAD4NFZ2_9BILA|nr:transmembrane amino acid transporter protein domain-containing protein [Ditylenchus destructor]